MSGDLTIYSPYEKVYDFWGQSKLDEVPAKLRDYLLLMPTKEFPQMIETNDNPRARLVKYLYYDTQKPLDQPMPSVKERLSLVFDPQKPDMAPTDKGYRVFSQTIVNQTQLAGQTTLRIMMGRTIPTGPYSAMIGVNFWIMSNYTLDANTKDMALLRTYAMELAIVEALNGVHIDGVGAFMFDRRSHSDCGSYGFSDEKQNVGRALTMCFESRGGSPDAGLTGK